MDNSGIGQMIKEYRVKNGLTQAELARRIGTSQQQLGLYEKDLRTPRADMLKAIARELGVSTEQLYPPDAYTAKMDFSDFEVTDMQNHLPRGFIVKGEPDDNSKVWLRFPYPDKTVLRNIPADELKALIEKAMDYLAYEINGMKGNPDYGK